MTDCMDTKILNIEICMNIVKRLKVLAKFILPKTLFGRSLIIVIAPVILAQGITTYVFYDRHWSKVTQLMADDLAGKISACVELFMNKNFREPGDYFIQRYAASHFGFNVSFNRGADLIQKPIRSSWREAILKPTLQHHINLPSYITVNDEFIDIYVAINEGIVHFRTPTKQLFTRTTPLLIWWALLTPLLFLLDCRYFFTQSSATFITASDDC